MSVEAVNAFHRLEIRPRLDSTAMLVLYNLCWRHNEKEDVARPGLDGISFDTDRARSVVSPALHRLEEAGLVQKVTGGGRGRATRFSLPFITLHRLRPGDKPLRIDWKPSRRRDSNKPSRESDSFLQETVPPSTENCPAQQPKTVPPAGHEIKEINKYPSDQVKTLAAQLGMERQSGETVKEFSQRVYAATKTRDAVVRNDDRYRGLFDDPKG